MHGPKAWGRTREVRTFLSLLFLNDFDLARGTKGKCGKINAQTIDLLPWVPEHIFREFTGPCKNEKYKPLAPRKSQDRVYAFPFNKDMVPFHLPPV